MVEDCGRVINPQLADEQVRGGCVQGLGGALYEHCIYDPAGQLVNGTMADYLVPMAAEMPDIDVAHVETPTSASPLGAKGVGESGTGAAPAVVMNAINDALRPFGVRVTTQPITPEARSCFPLMARSGPRPDRATTKPIMIRPAIVKRKPPISIGGSESTMIAIARYVEPQTT